MSTTQPASIPETQPRTQFEKSSENRANNFDFFRFVLAILVIFSHSFLLTQGDNRHEPFKIATRAQLSGGETAVDFFFILSGYLITQSWLRSKGLVSYFTKRILRIYPGFIAASLFGALAVGPIASSSPSDYWQQLSARHGSLVRFVMALLNLEPNIVPWIFVSNPLHWVNESLWTIRYEFLCYVVAAALGVVGAFRRRGFVLAGFIAIFALYFAQAYGYVQLNPGRFHRYHGQLKNWPRLMTCFLSGSLFYLYRDLIIYSPKLFLIAVVALMTAGGISWGGPFLLAVPTFGAYAFFYLGFLPAKRLAGFARRGDFSYGFYLYACPIQQLLVWKLGASLTPLTLFALAAPLTGVFALMSWHLVERPALRWKPRPRLAIESKHCNVIEESPQARV